MGKSCSTLHHSYLNLWIDISLSAIKGLFLCIPFQPTLETRGWLVSPFLNPMWTIPAALLPALLATILIFMDQQITAVIVNRKENKLLASIALI